MKILDIALNDMVRNFRSVMAVGMMFAVPLVITGLIFFAFGGTGGGAADLPVTRVVVVNHDTPPAGSPDFGNRLVEMLADPSVSKWLQSSPAADEATAIAMVNRQAAGVALIVPAGFSQAILTGEGQPEVRLVQDPTLTIGPMVVRNMLGSLIDGAAGARIALQADRQRRTELGLPADGGVSQIGPAYQEWFTEFQRTLYHSPQAALISQAPSQVAVSGSQVDDFQRIFALILVGMLIFFGFYTGANSMISILHDEEEGTLARIFTTPTDRTAVLAGKYLAVLLMVIVQGLVLMLLGTLLFKITWGDPLKTAMALAGQVVAATSLGVLLISLARNTRQAGAMVGGLLTVLGMMGGLFTVSAVGLPGIFDVVGLFTPQGWALRAWKGSFSAGPAADLLLPLGVLLAMGLVMFAIGASIFRRRFA